MKEDLLLEKALELCGESYEKAYDFIQDQKPAGDESPQILYFLMCLASGCQKREEALCHTEKADKNGFFYRADALDDQDLDFIREEPQFKRFYENSKKRFEQAKNNSKIIFEFSQKQKDKLVLCLHGNSQNAKKSYNDWRDFFDADWQIATLQSNNVDSYNAFRWDDNETDYKQLVNAFKSVENQDFCEIVFAGFSAGCNMIIRAITLSDIKPSEIFLQSPWIPFFENNKELVTKAIKEKNIACRIYCGSNDCDCLEPAQELYNSLIDSDVKAKFELQSGNYHCFPQE